jgi:hypothetical protein
MTKVKKIKKWWNDSFTIANELFYQVWSVQTFLGQFLYPFLVSKIKVYRYHKWGNPLLTVTPFRVLPKCRVFSAGMKIVIDKKFENTV